MVKLDEREKKLLKMCAEYGNDPFGAPNHNFMLLIAKLYEMLCDLGVDLLAPKVE